MTHDECPQENEAHASRHCDNSAQEEERPQIHRCIKMITTGPSFASEEESLSNDLCATLKRKLAQPTSNSTTSANQRDTITSTKKAGCI
ncbi:unnamed protein product [Brassica rapa subsp. trilocularis]